MMQTQGRSARMERGYDRMVAEFGPGTETERFTAAGVYDKLGMLVVLALLAGAVGYATDSMALVVVGLIGGLVLSLIGIFKPETARVVAPLYAVCEGLCLGALTAAFATGSSGIAPLAVIFTGGIFLAALAIFRTGLVRVTPRFVSMLMMAGVGFFLVSLAGVFGLFPGLSSQTGLLIFGVIGVVIGVGYLFFDFDYIRRGEERGLPVQGEWYGALLLMMSLAFVYLNVLRVLASRRR
jgi:uncharacterized YccA/Bax inhibitor family protein